MDFLSSLYVTLDPTLAEYIGLGISLVVSFLILQVAAAIPWLGDYLGQHKVGITAWLTTLVVQLIQARLDQIPESFDTIVVLVMNLIIQVIVIIIGFALLKRAQVKGHRALS